MIKVTGKVVYQKIEGGFWGIQGDDGQNYLPEAMPKDFQTEGMRVDAKMEPLEVMSTRMWGVEVKLHTIAAVEG